MKLIRQLNSHANTNPSDIKEDAAGGAVGAGGVAGFAMPLFASMIKRNISKKPRIIKYSNDETSKRKRKGLKLHEMITSLSEQDDQNFDTTEVISKLKSLEDKESVDYRDTSTFGLVDTNGGIVKVTIPSDQAQGFEQEIQYFLSGRDESEQAPEVAEILFKLKDRYTIVAVEWPQVEEDQEEGQELVGGAEGEAGAEGDLPPEGEAGMEDLPAEGEGIPAPGGEDTGQVQSLLTQVIDMMKADADARKAEAQAREAEAKTKQADAARHQAMARVKQEEQFMDMEEYNKAQKEKEKEAKRLASLAKWKHDMAKGEEELPAQAPQYDFLPGEEEEEIFSRPAQQKPQSGQKVLRGRVNPSDIAKFIMGRVK